MRIKKTFANVLTVLFSCMFAFSGLGCSEGEELTIDLIDRYEREDLIINQEYDASSLIVAEKGVDYSIDSLFYIDDNFERKDIPHDGMTFKQSLPYDVVLILGAKKGKQKDSEKVELRLNYEVDDVTARLMNSWNDSGIVKGYNAKSEYLTGAAITSLKTRYMGTINPTNNNGVVVGSISGGNAELAYSVTDWSNAVVEMDVYNAHDKDLQIGMLLYRKLNGKNDYKIAMLDELPVGEWTHVTWSLRALGWGGDFIGAGGYIDIKVKQIESNDSGRYDYTFYTCNIDVVNYDETRHVG